MRLYRIKNEVIRDKGAATIEDEIRKHRLGWFSHVKRWSVDTLVRRCEKITFQNIEEAEDNQRRRVTK